MTEEIEHTKCFIIGSGPAGYTAAIYAARANMEPVLYQGMQPGGQLMITTDVENYPGYPTGVEGPKMMEDFENQAKNMGADVRFGWVNEVDFTGPKHKVVIDGGQKTMTADTVIISTGADAKWLGLESEMRLRDIGGGVSACAVCDGSFYKGQDVAIVGAGDTACEEASYLAKLCNKVYMLIRKDHFKASHVMEQRVRNAENIEILFNHETVEVLGEQGVEGVLAKNNQTNEETTLKVSGFFVAIGHQPNTDIFKNWLDMDDTGYLLHEQGSTKTKVPGVFVSGDAADKKYRQAVTAAGTGCMAALDAEGYLAEKGLH